MKNGGGKERGGRKIESPFRFTRDIHYLQREWGKGGKEKSLLSELVSAAMGGGRGGKEKKGGRKGGRGGQLSAAKFLPSICKKKEKGGGEKGRKKRGKRRARMSRNSCGKKRGEGGEKEAGRMDHFFGATLTEEGGWGKKKEREKKRERDKILKGKRGGKKERLRAFAKLNQGRKGEKRKRGKKKKREGEEKRDSVFAEADREWGEVGKKTKRGRRFKKHWQRFDLSTGEKGKKIRRRGGGKGARFNSDFYGRA